MKLRVAVGVCSGLAWLVPGASLLLSGCTPRQQYVSTADSIRAMRAAEGSREPGLTAREQELRDQWEKQEAANRRNANVRLDVDERGNFNRFKGESGSAGPSAQQRRQQEQFAALQQATQSAAQEAVRNQQHMRDLDAQRRQDGRDAYDAEQQRHARRDARAEPQGHVSAEHGRSANAGSSAPAADPSSRGAGSPPSAGPSAPAAGPSSRGTGSLPGPSRRPGDVHVSLKTDLIATSGFGSEELAREHLPVVLTNKLVDLCEDYAKRTQGMIHGTLDYDSVKVEDLTVSCTGQNIKFCEAKGRGKGTCALARAE